MDNPALDGWMGDNREVNENRSEPTSLAPRTCEENNHGSETQFVRTTIIHRRALTSGPWWHTATISEIPGVIDEEGAQCLQDTVFAIARMGFSAVLFRPALLDFDKQKQVLTDLIHAIHRVGMKAIVRLSGADHAPPYRKKPRRRSSDMKVKPLPWWYELAPRCWPALTASTWGVSRTPRKPPAARIKVNVSPNSPAYCWRN